jgi:hypothetical protein
MHIRDPYPLWIKALFVARKLNGNPARAELFKNQASHTNVPTTHTKESVACQSWGEIADLADVAVAA